MRLASGAAHGVQQAVAGLRMAETPSPARPRVLELTEDRTVSEAGSQEAVTATASHSIDNSFEQQVMEQLKAMQEKMNRLESENQRLRGQDNSPAAISRFKSFTTRVSPS